MLDHDAYDFAAALCEALAAVVGDIGMDRTGRIERTILLVEQPGVHVDVMAAWADVDG